MTATAQAADDGTLAWVPEQQVACVALLIAHTLCFVSIDDGQWTLTEKGRALLLDISTVLQENQLPPAEAKGFRKEIV